MGKRKHIGDVFVIYWLFGSSVFLFEAGSLHAAMALFDLTMLPLNSDTAAPDLLALELNLCTTIPGLTQCLSKERFAVGEQV